MPDWQNWKTNIIVVRLRMSGAKIRASDDHPVDRLEDEAELAFARGSVGAALDPRGETAGASENVLTRA
jgi:hypothetical protein